jgi:hypothetical protein
LTNQNAFDLAVLHLLNQGHRCVSASGKPRYRGSRGKSAIGALIPDQLYVTAMEDKTLHQMLHSSSADYEKLRERLGGVTPALLSELQDLHDRMGECLPSMFRHLVLAGSSRIAQMFGLTPRMTHLWVAYQRIPGPQKPRPAPDGTASRPAGDFKRVA